MEEKKEKTAFRMRERERESGVEGLRAERAVPRAMPASGCACVRA